MWENSTFHVNCNNLIAPWDASIWVPKYGEDMKAIEGFSFTTSAYKKNMTTLYEDVG